MLRPLTRSSSGKFKRNTRHSFKKSSYSLKNHVATNHRGTPQIRKSISKKSINKSNLTTSIPKVARSVSSPKRKHLSDDSPKISVYRLRTKSENILETPIPQLRKKSTFIKHFQDKLPLNIRKSITEIKQSISTNFKRVTRSSMGNIDDRNLIKNRSHVSRLAISPLSKYTEKQIKSNTAVKVKELNIAAKGSKRMTRSSVGKVTLSSIGNVTHSSIGKGACKIFLKSRSSKDKLINLQQSTQKHIECKEIKEKMNDIENPKRVTRCSLGKVACKSGSSKDKLFTLHQSTEKHIKCKEILKEEKMNDITENPKRVTRCSLGNVPFNTFLKSRSSKDKLFTLHQSTEKHIKCTEILKEKKKNDITENTKCVTRRSIGGSIVSSSLKKTSKDNFVAASMLKNAERPVNSKHMACFSFETHTDSTPLKKTPKRTSVISPTPLSARVRSKSGKGAVIIEKDYEQLDLCSLNNTSPSKQSPERGSDKQQCKTRNVYPASFNSKHASQMKSVESTCVALTRNARKSNSRSLTAKKLPKRNCKSSPVSKGVKRKATGSPLKHKKSASLKANDANEDNIPLDCLAMDILTKRPRRHTVDVYIQNKKAPNPSTIQQKTRKTSTSKTKSSKRRKDNSTLSQSNSMFSAAPDLSQLPVDCLTTFRSQSKSGKKRPKSAPAAIKRKSKVAGLRTPIPKKGTLKRQRWMFNALKEKNEGYEDDIFENQTFQTPVFRKLNDVDDESDSSIPTPKFGFLLTPALPKETHGYKETISPSDLLLARKNAEEYLYRRNKKRATDHSTLNSPSKSQKSVVCDEVPEKKKLEFTEAMEKVKSICKALEEKIEYESEEDDYFTDGLT